jgi:hypothetical protein
MAQQIVNIGTVANDGTGDPDRTAFNKINQNFTEVYATPYFLPIALSDEATAITTGTGILTTYCDVAFDLSEVFIGLSNQSSSGAVEIDIKKNSSTIFSTRPKVDASEDTSLTGTAAVLSTTSFAKGDKLTFDITSAGTGAKGLKAFLIGTRTP